MDACLIISRQVGNLLIDKKYGKTIINRYVVDEKVFITTFLNAAKLYYEFSEKYFSHTNLMEEKKYLQKLIQCYK